MTFTPDLSGMEPMSDLMEHLDLEGAYIETRPMQGGAIYRVLAVYPGDGIRALNVHGADEGRVVNLPSHIAARLLPNQRLAHAIYGDVAPKTPQ